MANIRNRYNQVPHLSQYTTWESDKTQENITYNRVKRLILSQQVTTRLHLLDKKALQKASIISACLSSERDIIKSLPSKNKIKSATSGAELVSI